MTRRCEWKRFGTALAVVLLGGGAMTTGGEAAAQERDFEWTGALEAGDVLEVVGVSGSVEARPAEAGEASVHADKRGRRSDASEVRIEVVEHDGGVTVCPVYPHSRRQNRCEPGGGGSSVNDNDVRVDFDVRVPAGVRFHGRTVNGEIQVRGLESDVEARTVNGDVEVSTRGAAEARTVNGSVRASVGRSPQHPLELETVNGGIELDLPDEANADVKAKWINGELESDLPLRIVGRLSRHRAEGHLGEGGPLLQLSTVNGSIRIR